MRTGKHDPYLTRMRDSLTVPKQRSTRTKLIGSMSVLALVLGAAAVEQFERKPRDPLREPVGQTRERREAPVERDRAVFGDRVRPEVPPPVAPREEKTEKTERAAARTRPEGSPADVREFLDEWRSTLIAGDAEAQASLYAPRVERFFTKKNVSREAVQREKASLLARYPTFHKYEIRDVRVEELDGNRALVTFDKEWDARGAGRFAGAERQRLTLQRAGDRWEIVGEEELKVYWVKRDRRT